MLTYAFFLSNRRESLSRAFRKKTPLIVRRPGGGAKGGTERVHRNVTFFLDGFPKGSSFKFGVLGIGKTPPMLGKFTK